ncbi:hypothetical protein TNCV_1381 [Trichonephila clavipes]|nr:hypothetical protein TNCV_1381 [Trichonephila clavipes]
MKGGLYSAHGSAGSRSHITNHSTTYSVSYVSFGVCSYPSTPFASEWNVRKAFIASFIFDWKPLAFAPPMVQLKGGNEQRKGTTLGLLTNPTSACNIQDARI